MREIKAYIRKAKLEDAVHALEAIGVTDMSVLETREVKGRETPQGRTLSVDMSESFARVARLEIVCRKERAAEIVRVLREAAYTGRQGDGIIYVTPVERAVKIRTGLEEI